MVGGGDKTAEPFEVYSPLLCQRALTRVNKQWLLIGCLEEKEEEEESPYEGAQQQGFVFKPCTSSTKLQFANDPAVWFGMSCRRVYLSSVLMTEIARDTHSSEDGSVFKKKHPCPVFGTLVDCGERGRAAVDGTPHSVTNNASEPLQ